MPTSLEIEKKFLIKFPSSWEELSELFDSLVEVERMTQTYLQPEDDEPSARVRKTVKGLSDNKQILYHYNQKFKIESGIHQEKEHEITKKQYENYLKKAHPDKFTVEKIRFVFDYNEQIFELDVFKGPLKGLAVLEIELPSKDSKVELPPFLQVVKDVTKDSKYSNFNLASK